MRVLEIVLDDDLSEKLEAIAQALGLPLDVVVVMACQKYVRRVEEHGLPRITGVMLRGPSTNHDSDKD